MHIKVAGVFEWEQFDADPDKICYYLHNKMEIMIQTFWSCSGFPIFYELICGNGWFKI